MLIIITLILAGYVLWNVYAEVKEQRRVSCADCAYMPQGCVMSSPGTHTCQKFMKA